MTADTTASPSGADDDRAFDIDPDGDAAAYDEWAAIAGEPARPPDHPQRDFADNQASFDAIASSLTETQIKAASCNCHARDSDRSEVAVTGGSPTALGHV